MQMMLSLLLTALFLATSLPPPAQAFAPTHSASRPTAPPLTAVFSSDSDDAAASGEGTIYPALSQEEIEQWLSRIPVYAVTDTKEGGVVLMSEGGEKGIAYFFITKEAAEATLNQMKSSNPDTPDWDVTGLSLGAIWFDLLNSDSAGFSESQVKSKSLVGGEVMETSMEGVEYRLVPDYRDLNGARMLLSQDEQSKKALEESGKFKASHGEVPVFMDLQIRVEQDGEKEKFPMYLALQDMVTTCQQFMKSIGDDTYEAAINVAELSGLVEQMQEDSAVDFRQALLIPPVPGASGGGEDVGESYSPSMNTEW